MKLGTIVNTSFILGISSTWVGAFLKVSHYAGASTMLIIGIISTVIFTACAIYEVRSSKRIANDEKILWYFLFVFFHGISGLVYFFIGRKRIA